jgi:hypothetical protein
VKIFERLPDDVRALVPSGDRLLAWCDSEPEGRLLATTCRLIAPPAAVDVSWVEVLAAAWDDPILEVTLWRPSAPANVALRLRNGGVLPQVVRERIMQSLLVQQHVRLVGNLGVRLLARRDPATDETFWQRVFDVGIDPQDPEIRASVAAAQMNLTEVYGVGRQGH